MHPELLLTVHVGQGRRFPTFQPGDENRCRLLCVATFNGETRTCLSSTIGPGSPVWDCCLEWRLGAQQLRVLEAAGGGHCKVTFARQDGRRVGWVVCDLRSGRLHAKHPRKPAWWAVAGPFKGKDTPEVQVYHTLTELPVPQHPGPAMGTGPLPAAPAGTTGSIPPFAALPPAPLPPAYAAPHPTPAAGPGSGMPAGVAPSDGWATADERLLQQAGAVSQGIVADGSLRRFEFGLDLRQFQAGRRLPLNLASVVVQLSLPQEFAGLILQSNGRLPPRLAPLRTQPPVDVRRGCEAALPGGQASVQFTAGLMALATLLARGPIMTLDVLHKEHLAEDTLLGRAHVPLAPLLQESWVDGRAGVFASVPAADGSGGDERVQVGTLHLVMSLEEVGPATAATEQLPSLAATPRHGAPSKKPLQRAPSLGATPRDPHAAPLRPIQPPQQAAPSAAAAVAAPEQQLQQLLGIPAQPLPAMAQRTSQQMEQIVLPGGEAAAARDAYAAVEPQQGIIEGSEPRGSSIAEEPTPPAVNSSSLAAGASSVSASPGVQAEQNSAAQAVTPQASLTAQLSGAAKLSREVSREVSREEQQSFQSLAGSATEMTETLPQDSCLEGIEALPSALPSAAPAEHGAPAGPASALHTLAPEIEAAWELEVWKRQEEERWRAELKQREAERMAALEAEWRRRQSEQEAEQATLRQEYTALQARAQQVLAATEEREKKVLAAEEEVARRRRELEREHAARVAEAEATVRRLQMEFEHQMELERLRASQLLQQQAAAEERAAAAEAKAAAADRTLQEFKEQHARSPAGVLERELGEARAVLAEAEQRAAKAGEAKRKYKEQVVRLAQEVSTLQRHLAEVVGLKREQLDAELMKVAAQEAALAARREAGDLGALRRDLRALQAGGGGGKDSAGPPGAPLLVLGPGAQSQQVQRLLQEREDLLASGAYAAEDPLIQQLDRRIRECAAAAAATMAGGATHGEAALGTASPCRQGS